MTDDIVNKVLRHPFAGLRPGATSDQLSRLEATIEGPIASVLRAIWSQSDGVSFDQRECEILSVEEVIQLTAPGGWFHEMRKHRYPFFSDRQSNFLSLFYRGPRTGRVDWVIHDDASQLLYRNPEPALLDVLDEIDTPDTLGVGFVFRPKRVDYCDESPRDSHDRSDARALLSEPDQGYEGDNWIHAAKLAGEEDIDLWHQLLDASRPASKSALRRLGKLNNPACAELLRQRETDFENWVQSLETTVRSAGLKVKRESDGSFRVKRTPLNLEAFYKRRNQVDAEQRLRLWFEDEAAKKNPRERANHYFA